MFTIVTTLLSIYTRQKRLTIHRFGLRFTVGGFLLFIGREKIPTRSNKHVGKKLHITFMVVTFIGIALFYLILVPEIIKFIHSFINYVVGSTRLAPQPVMIPTPLLFQFQDLIPYFLIAICIAAVVHEFMHAFIALKEGVNIRSWGVGLLFFIPLAFVELDDNKFNSSSTKTKLNIVTAGIFGNAIVALISLSLLITINNVIPIFFGTPSSAIEINSIDCSICNTSLCPAKIFGLRSNTIIMSINNITIKSVNEVVRILQNSEIGSNITLNICDYSGSCSLVVLTLNAHKKENKSIPCIGISFNSVPVFISNNVPRRIIWLENLMFLISIITIINFSLFVINAIPLFITDGSLFLRYLSEKIPILNKIVSIKAIDILNTVIIIIATILSSYILLT